MPAPQPATARLRRQLYAIADVDTLVAMFAACLSEHGIDGHFIMAGTAAGPVPMAGDAPELVLAPPGCLIVEGGGHCIVLAGPCVPLAPDADARVRGYAVLVAAQIAALRELADDVETGCALSLRERYVLGRRLAGLAPVDIAAECGLGVQTIAAAIDSAVAAMNAGTPAEAISLAARRGWLVVSSLQNCSSSSEVFTYKMAQNG